MRAAQLTRLDGPDGVEISEIDEPTGDGVIVDVHAAGAAFPDALLTRGLYQYRPDPPFVLGAEIAGVVRSAPADAPVKTGDRVVGLTMLTGGMAEVAVLAPDRVFKLKYTVRSLNSRPAPAAVCTRARRCWCKALPAASAPQHCDWRRCSARRA